MSRWLTTVALLLVLFSGCSQKKEETNRLVVGMELAYPPFEMTDAKGAPSGVSVDLAREMGKHLGKEVVIENTPFDGLIPSLKTGKIDLIISSMTATPERAQSVDFSEPYLTTGLALLVGAKSGVESITDLDQAGKTVVVKKGTTGHIYATENLKAAQIRVLDKENMAVLEVAQGKADAFIYDQMSVLKNWQEHKETTRPLLQAFKTEQWAIALRKGNDPLREQVNQFLKEFRSKGGFEELGNVWLKEQKEEFQKRGIPFVF
ncbi:MAG: transporter substrate-binding domain-containing protein [Verrucomicrobiaceae bacterium]|nr:MAG: transporter substrate-binding domain-containing protein [Verrucomicrobiaceae bacterium]